MGVSGAEQGGRAVQARQAAMPRPPSDSPISEAMENGFTGESCLGVELVTDFGF